MLYVCLDIVNTAATGEGDGVEGQVGDVSREGGREEGRKGERKV